MLSRSERREDQARIQLELGKLYLHEGFIHDASNALYLSLELFDGEDESAFELLQRVEFLGQRDNHERMRQSSEIDSRSNDIADEQRVGVDSLPAIIEDGESDFFTEGTSALTSSLSAALRDGNSKGAKDDDNDSEDLSKILTEIDKADDHYLQQNCDDSPSEATDSQQDRHYATSELLEDEEDEEEFSQQIDKTDGLYSTPVEVKEIYSNDSPSNERPEITNTETHNSEPASKDLIDNEFEETGKTQQNMDNFDFQEDPIVHQNGRSSQIHDTPDTVHSANSRTALLDSAEDPTATKVLLSLPKMSSPPKSSSPKLSSSKRATSEKISIGRKGYTEINTIRKQPGGTGKRSIVKALASPFRRSRSKSRSTTSNPLVPLDEEKEVRQPMPTKKPYKDPVEEESCYSHNAPISYIDVQGTSDDDRSLVSQLTFREYEMLSKKKEIHNENGHWWWGVTSEGLEGWFPSDYVNQAVEAAEGFLSAKSIHDRVKSRPLDFDSDEESVSEEVDEDFTLLNDSFSQQSKDQGKANDSPKSKSPEPMDLSQQPPKESLDSSRKDIESSSKKEADGSNSGTNKYQSLDSLIQAKEIELEDTRKENGHEDISVARSLFHLAELHLRRKDPTVAMRYSRQAMKIQKATLNLPEACRSLNFMAELHSRENRYKDALLCYSEVQRIHESTYGYFHEEIAKDLNHCGHILARQGKFDLAMDKHKEALRILKDCCGENVKNPLVSETLIQIGAVYYKERNSLANIKSKQNDGYKTFIEGGMLEVIGRAHEDRGSYRMAIAFFEEKLQFLNNGERLNESEDVAETLNSLGMLSCRAGMYLEAIDYYDRALGIQMKLGCNDIQLAMARVLAGSVQYSLGHFNKSLKLFQDALDTLRRVGLEQETVAATLFHIGAVHAALCNYDKAMSNLRDAFEIQSKLLGIEHPATFRTRREIGNLYAIYESEVDAAFDEYNDIMEAQKRIHGDKHPYVAETLHSIGCAKARKGDFSGALLTLEDCYNMRLKFLGMDHPQQATTLHEIAKIQLKRGRLKKAIHIIDAALNIRVESLSDQHIDVALAMTTKASCLVARLNFVDANKLFTEALPIAKAAVGDLHPSVAWIQVQIGVMHLRKCNFEKASNTVKEAIAIYQKSNLDGDHPGIQEATEELERIERAEMLCV
jgi:tetratricopeptide (TPR) repeat protein